MQQDDRTQRQNKFNYRYQCCQQKLRSVTSLRLDYNYLNPYSCWNFIRKYSLIIHDSGA